MESDWNQEEDLQPNETQPPCPPQPPSPQPNEPSSSQPSECMEIDWNQEEDLQPNETQVRSLKKKLIVLDINGLLVDVVYPIPMGCKPDSTFRKKALFTRPSYLEFLEFCFDKFEVGIWSSKMKINVEGIIDLLMRDLKTKFLFCWIDDNYHSLLLAFLLLLESHCTQTTFKTPENEQKPIVFKDLKKLWHKDDPNLPWEKGYYNESNTLLLDDSPYKALLNPPNTSVFPRTFSYLDKSSDNSLAEGGELRVYLDGLAKAEDMRKYIKENSFGQPGISETTESWNFYRVVIDSLSGGQNSPGYHGI